MSEPDLTSFTSDSLDIVYRDALVEHVALRTRIVRLIDQDKSVVERMNTIGNELVSRAY